MDKVKYKATYSRATGVHNLWRGWHMYADTKASGAPYFQVLTLFAAAPNVGSIIKK